MKTVSVAQCPSCREDVVAGTLFCWRHASNAPRVGDIEADGGQLLWKSSGDCQGSMERSLAILVGNVQKFVVHAEPRTTRVELELTDGRPGAPVTRASVLLCEMYRQIVDGREFVEATLD